MKKLDVFDVISCIIATTCVIVNKYEGKDSNQEEHQAMYKKIYEDDRNKENISMIVAIVKRILENYYQQKIEIGLTEESIKTMFEAARGNAKMQEELFRAIYNQNTKNAHKN